MTKTNEPQQQVATLSRLHKHHAPITDKDCLLVLGMHRSGTSLCSSIIHKLGVNMVHTNDAGAFDNLPGHWERFDLVELHDNIFISFGQAWSSLASLPAAWWRAPALEDFKRQLLATVRTLPQGLPWGIKDPRITRLYPLWEEMARSLGLSLKVIVCIRKPRDVAASLAKRNGFDLNYGKLLWLRHYTELFQNQLPDDLLIVDYDDWFECGHKNILDIVNFLGLGNTLSNLTIDAILTETVSDKLQNNKSQPEHDYCSFIYDKLRSAGNDIQARDELSLLFSNIELLNKYYTEIYTQSFLYEDSKKYSETLFSENAAWKASLAAVQVRETELQEALERERESANALEAGNAGLQDALAAEQALAGELQTRLAAATADIAQARSEAEAARLERDRAMAETEARQRSLDAALADIAQARSEAETARLERDAALAEVQALDAALADATGRSEGLRQQLAALDARCGALESCLASLGRERGHLLRDLVAAWAAASADAHPCHFNEAFYLQANPDVAKAVADKLVASGLHHWLRFGYAENRAVSFLGDDASDT